MISNENLNRNKMFSEAVKRMKLMKVNLCDSQIIEQNKNLHFKIVVNHMEKSVGRKELTEEERLRQENKILQAKIKDQEMEIALLKKLRELRGGDW